MNNRLYNEHPETRNLKPSPLTDEDLKRGKKLGEKPLFIRGPVGYMGVEVDRYGNFVRFV